VSLDTKRNELRIALFLVVAQHVTLEKLLAYLSHKRVEILNNYDKDKETGTPMMSIHFRISFIMDTLNQNLQ